MERHKIAVDSTCRMCSERAQSAKKVKSKQYPWYVRKIMDDISVLFGVDVSTDDSSTHSQNCVINAIDTYYIHGMCPCHVTT